MCDFDYGKAEADLDGMGCPDPEEIYDYSTEKGFDSFMRENGLNPDNYKKGNSSNGSSSSGTDGCYLTSACVYARGLSDNCYELTTLRNFRDSFLKKMDNGLKDIEYYYNVAPKIVSKINLLENAKTIWNKIYDELVVTSVNLIKENRFNDAYKLYKDYSLSLEQKYLK